MSEFDLNFNPEKSKAYFTESREYSEKAQEDIDVFSDQIALGETGYNAISNAFKNNTDLYNSVFFQKNDTREAFNERLSDEKFSDITEKISSDVLFSMVDVDGDGTINEEEYAALINMHDDTQYFDVWNLAAESFNQAEALHPEKFSDSDSVSGTTGGTTSSGTADGSEAVDGEDTVVDEDTGVTTDETDESDDGKTSSLSDDEIISKLDTLLSSGAAESIDDAVAMLQSQGIEVSDDLISHFSQYNSKDESKIQGIMSAMDMTRAEAIDYLKNNGGLGDPISTGSTGEVDDKDIALKCSQLAAAMEDLGTDEAAVKDIIMNASDAELVAMMQAYSDKNGNDLFAAIQKDFSGVSSDISEAELTTKLMSALMNTYNEQTGGESDAAYITEAGTLHRSVNSSRWAFWNGVDKKDKAMDALNEKDPTEAAKIIAAYYQEYGDLSSDVRNQAWFGSQESRMHDLYSIMISQID